MKLGLDVHGVLDGRHKEFFAVLSNLFVNGGHEVHIITGSTENSELKLMLESNGITWTHFFSIADYNKRIGTKIVYLEDHPWMDAEIWNKTKGDYCEREQIDLMIDDSDSYWKYFKTPYALFKICKK